MRDYALLAKSLRHCAENGLCSDCPMYDNCPDLDGKKNAADAIEELLEWKRMLESKNNLQAKIIKHMETVMKVNGLPTPPKEET